MKPLKFVRFGGLSPVNHKKFYKMDTFHSPPRKKGIYAFIFPYIENFLWAWKVKGSTPEDFKRYHREQRRKFTYEGELWVHWIKQAKRINAGIEYKKDWVKIHTDDFKELLTMVKQDDRMDLSSDSMLGYKKGEARPSIHDPYKTGQRGWMSRDHLEVFIERVK